MLAFWSSSTLRRMKATLGFTTSYPFINCSLIRSFVAEDGLYCPLQIRHLEQSINLSNNQTSSVHGQLIFTSITFALLTPSGATSNVLYGEAQTQGDTCTSYDGLYGEARPERDTFSRFEYTKGQG